MCLLFNVSPSMSSSTGSPWYGQSNLYPYRRSNSWQSLIILYFRLYYRPSSPCWHSITVASIISLSRGHGRGRPSELLAISKKLTNPFWRDAIKVASEMIKSISYDQPNKIMLYPIFTNPLFKKGNRAISSNAIAGNNGNIKQVADFLAGKQLYEL